MSPPDDPDLEYRSTVAEIRENPESPEALHRLGVIYACRGEWDAARRSMEQALRLRSHCSGWWRDFGLVLFHADRVEEAVECLWHGIQLDEDPRGWAYYGEALGRCGLQDDAIEAVTRSQQMAPDSYGAQYDAARVFDRLEYWNEAFVAYERTIDLKPDEPEPYERLGELYSRFRFDGRSYWASANLARLRDDFESHVRLADACFQVGRIGESLRAYRRAMQLQPGSASLHSEYLRVMLHSPALDPDILRDEHEAWFRQHAAAGCKNIRFTNDPDPDRKLRIGYLSGEFKITPAHYFLLPLMAAHDRRQFEVFCYHRAPEKDSSTENYRRLADHWSEVQLDSEQELQSRILADRIDVLVDLSGHYRDHALGVFARRAAPVQATYPNYPATTGCRNIDYFFSDRWTTPDRDAERQYAETSVYYLPSGYLTYAPVMDGPDVTPLPALSNGFVTFGLFQRPAKLHEAILDAVACVLRRVPSSRLLVQNATRDFSEEGGLLREQILAPLRKHGIGASRVDFAGLQHVNGFLELLGGADIALDSFPYAGQTTTCGCLWMGVPVVSLAGRPHVARVGCGLLARVGLADWVAASVDEYVEIACAKAADLASLAILRSTLRDRLLASSICQPERVTRQIEDAYRWMWKRWCASLRSEP